MNLLPKKNLSTKARSKRSERRCAELVNGKVQPASGAIDRYDLKADVKSATLLIDDKTTARESFSVNLKLWRKLADEAYSNHKSPVMRIEFSNGPTVYVLDELLFLEKVISE